MAISDALRAELKQETATTRKLLERVPEDEFDWKPHEKSMGLGRLAAHVVELHGFFRPVLTQSELDFAARSGPFEPKTREELLKTFDSRVADALDLLSGQSDEQLRTTWRLRRGERILLELPRAAALRMIAMNHVVHHRGQLSVYLRLLD